MRILVDVNLSPQWVPFLRAHGFEASHWTTVGTISAPDREILKWARANGHIVFTHDLDFGTLLALTGATGPSVIQVRSQDVMPDSLGNVVLGVLQEHRMALDKGALVTVDRATARVRVLPLAR